MPSKPDIVIIGAGPAGLGLAWKLALRGDSIVHVLERGPAVGGNAGSFDIDGIRVDFGSHRLHPACDPGILADIRQFLRDDLLDRPRHGRIRLLGRWVHFPLKPFDLVTNLPPSFAAGAAADTVRKQFAGNHKGEETFATVLEAGLGRTICREFYFPYAWKIWGLDPDDLHAEQARRRVAASSTGKLIRKVLSAVPGLKPPGAGRFFYPRMGFGQISEAYAAAAKKAGANIVLGAEVLALDRDGDGWNVRYRTSTSGEHSIHTAAVFSSIPMPALTGLLGAPAGIRHAAGSLAYRAMILIYVLLDRDQYTGYDAHYFPGREVRITRMSEPKNYGLARASGRTVLCAELPCDTAGDVWSMSNEQLGELFRESIAAARLPDPGPFRRIETRRLPQAYPIYKRDFFEHFEAIDRWLEQVPGVLTFGRQGLFVHDNTHHALRMAYAAAECYSGGRFDGDRWKHWRTEFASHVVED
jgi:protoporphyrinogen oxidase